MSCLGLRGLNGPSQLVGFQSTFIWFCPWRILQQLVGGVEPDAQCMDEGAQQYLYNVEEKQPALEWSETLWYSTVRTDNDNDNDNSNDSDSEKWVMSNK